MKILMVCLGNICRSPLAEGIMQAKIDALNLDWQVDSAGTSSWHVGELPDSRSIDTARQHDMDITQQRSRKLVAEDLNQFDLVLAMDSSNYQNILRLATTTAQKEKVKMIMNFADPGKNQSVPDPYYNDGFENVYQMLDRACSGIIEEYQ